MEKPEEIERERNLITFSSQITVYIVVVKH